MKTRDGALVIPPGRALILARPDRLGDVIISTSCLAPVRARFPQAKIYFVAAESWRSLLEDHPLLDGFISVNAHLTNRLAELRPAAIVHLQPGEECLRAAKDAGVPIRIGYRGRWPDELLSHSIRDRRAEGLQHEGAYNFDLLSFLGVEKPVSLHMQVPLNQSERASLQEKVQWQLSDEPYVVLSPIAHSLKKSWPYERFRRLAGILHEWGFHVVFAGADVPRTAAGSSLALNLSGLTSVGELAWLLQQARLLVSNDTGSGHLAAAVGCPGITIFGRTDPEYGTVRWQPLSDDGVVLRSPARRRFLEPTEKYWRRAFAAISVEEVAEAAKQILRQI